MKKVTAIIVSILSAGIMTACNSSETTSEVKQDEKAEETTVTTTAETETIGTTVLTESEPDTITTYEKERVWHEDTYLYANFETYNSPAEENGLKDTKIYIVCDDFGSEGYHYLNSEIPYAVAKSIDGGSWEIGLSLFSGTEGDSFLWESEKDKLIGGGQTIIYGTYLGYSNKFNRPLVMAEQIENDNGSFNFYEFFYTDYFADSLLIPDESETTTTTTKTTTAETTTTATITKETIPIGKKNALSTALSYLKYSAFSYNGLFEQLKYEGYTDEEALYGVDNCGADWYEQAVKMAESYLKFSSFSREGLIEQLEYEGFTHDQAEYGVTAVGY